MKKQPGKPWAIATSNKANIQLSDFALQVLTTDLFSFNLMKDGKEFIKSRTEDVNEKEEKRKQYQGKHQGYYLGSIINKIIEFFGQEAKASIDKRLEERKTDLSGALKDVKGLSDDVRRSVTDALLEAYKEELIEHRDFLLGAAGAQNRKADRVTFTLSAKNIELLNEDNGSGEEEHKTGSRRKEYKYYGKRVDYIRAVCEEYARLSHSERERIFFADRSNVIKNAIHEQRRLLLIPQAEGSTKAAGHKHLMIPYGEVAGYLIGYTQRIDKPDTAPYICPFRLGALKRIEINNEDPVSRRYVLSDEQKRKIEDAIEKKGAPYCREKDASDALRKIMLRLTDAGLKTYMRTASSGRPRMDRWQHKEDIDENIYTFICTLSNAKFYFKRLGENAEVLEVLEMSGEKNEEYTEELRAYLSGGASEETKEIRQVEREGKDEGDYEGFER